jgi:hypothetical protein
MRAAKTNILKIIQFTMMLLTLSACSINSIIPCKNSNLSIQVKSDTLYYEGKEYNHILVVQDNKIIMNGFWNTTSDSIWYIPYFTKENNCLQSILFCVLSDSNFYQMNNTTCKNERLLGVVYPTIVSSELKWSKHLKQYFYVVKHNLVEFGDFTGKTDKNSLAVRTFVFNGEKKLVCLTSFDVGNSGDLYPYD